MTSSPASRVPSPRSRACLAGALAKAGPGVLRSWGPGVLAAIVSLSAACATGAPVGPVGPAAPVEPVEPVEQALNKIFDDARFSRALFGVRVESLADGRVIYTRNPGTLVVPASNMKLLTLSAAAEKLGWDFTFETKLDVAGTVSDGTLTGDLIVVGSGDPSIDGVGFEPAPVFAEWADVIAKAGIRRVDGRLIGDDNVFDDTTAGPGWAWDYLTDGYAAGSAGLNYNENAVVIRVWPGATAGAAGRVELSPAGHGLTVKSSVTTGAADSAASVTHARRLGETTVAVSGSIPLGRAPLVRTTTIENPTQFFIDGFKDALASRGITVTGGAWDIDGLATAPGTAGRRTIAVRRSLPLSSLGGYFLKESQNFYGEVLLKTLGQRFGRAGSTTAGRRVASETLAAWGIPADSFVMYDGSGLSRYNYVSADAIVQLLKHVWTDEKLRGPFLAALPVGGQDGTLGSRMRNTVLAGKVQAKTGTISNVRSLSGYLVTESGERLVFSMIANNFTATSAQVDAVVETALAYLATHSRAR
jgi:D-alanyl-D-alanine carboxypeptidase/D-alanyl-D-alanine-endopeptidase (penicillin-binding protein 4)